MRKIIFILLASIISSSSLLSQTNYSKVKIDLMSNNIAEIAKSGIDVTDGQYKKGTFLITDLSDTEIENIKKAGIAYEVIIPDVDSFYEQRSKNDIQQLKRNVEDEWPIPQNWEYGSMGGFYTLDEVMSELDDMVAQYPNLISPRYAISPDTLTHDGRQLYWLRISDNPLTNEDEPEILYTALHHAREPIGVQQMIYYMWYLLENYATDPDIQILVDNTEMYFVPVVNPDGYEHNHLTNPNGGGMWRKNRRNNGDGTYGVDPNRNYGYKWGNDDNGSSPITSDETYRGPSAFSEPEIKNMRDFCNDHEFKLALNYHSYSNLLLYPWGWTEDVTPDDDIFHDFAVLMTEENNYTVGPASTTIYPVNGDSNDWMYGEQDTKDKVFAYVPEVGNGNDGFWPSTSRIVPLCQENMLQNITAARLVGKYAELTETSPMATDALESNIKYDIKRLGLTDAEQFTVSLTALDDYVESTGNDDIFLNMDLMQIESDSISYTLNADIEGGTEFKLLLTVDNGMYTVSDTITKIFGTMVVVFDDNGDNLDNWTSLKWETTDEDSHSAANSITDSKNSDYQSGLNSKITMDTSIDLIDTDIAFISFWAKWDIEAGYDYVQILIKRTDDASYTPLEGKYTKKGANYYLDDSQPYYDGTTDWVHEEINISEYTGSEIKIRFVLVTDQYVEADGFYFDDFTVSILSTTTSVNSEELDQVFISNPYPNPHTNSFTLRYNLGYNKKASLLIYNSFGSLVAERPLNKRQDVITVDTKNLPSGIYYLSIIGPGFKSGTNKFIKL
jgi:hypothetical protein